MANGNLTEAELDRLLSPASFGDRRSSVYQRDRILVELLAHTGMRVGEVLGLVRSEIHLDHPEGPCIVIPPERVKTRTERKVFLAPVILGRLAAYLEFLPADQERLFLTGTGKPLTDRHVRRYMKKLARRAGVEPERVHAHAFRHAYAFRWLERTHGNEQELHLLMHQLGHKLLSTTSIYTKADSPRRAGVVAALDL